jgi:hypothetical protein
MKKKINTQIVFDSAATASSSREKSLNIPYDVSHILVGDTALKANSRFYSDHR